MADEPARLRGFIVDHYSLAEFRTLCFDLGVRYDVPVGEGLADKVRELILHMWRQERLADLLAILQESRPVPFGRAGLRQDPVELEEALATAYQPSLDVELPAMPEPRREDRRWQLILRAVAVLSWGVAVVWMLVEPGFEPLLAALAGIVSLVTSFMIGHDSDRSAWAEIFMQESEFVDVRE